MSKPKDKQPTETEEEAPAAALEFLLEATFPDATNLFTSNVVTIEPDGDFLVAIDTNVLILPYKIDAEDLSALSSTYRTLAKAGKLFLPARASREFLQHRDRKLADVVVGLNNRLSRLVPPEAKLSPILVGVEGYDELPDIAAAATEAVKTYRTALQRLINKVKQWRGDDPVSQLYADVFNAGNIIEAPGSQAQLRKEWATRSASKLPPGYQDAPKEDSGIGDFLIWKSLLEIGRTHQKDLVFLTLDDKSDWAVRGNQEAIYPRPELIDEYRRASGGKSLYLSHLGEFLKKMHVSEEVVANVKAAETTENSETSTSVVTDNDFLVWMQKFPTTVEKLKSLSNRGQPRFSVAETIAPIIPVDFAMSKSIHGWNNGDSATLRMGELGSNLANLGPIPKNAVISPGHIDYVREITVRKDDVIAIRTTAMIQVMRITDTQAAGNFLTLLVSYAFAPHDAPILVP
jgi:hypothetical protein